MNKMLVAGVSIIMLAMVVVGYAAYTIFSNTIMETVGDYSFKNSLRIDNSMPVFNTSVTLNGTLYYANSPAPNKPVYLLKNVNSTSWMIVANSTTDANGFFKFTITRTELGQVEYQVGFDVP